MLILLPRLFEVQLVGDLGIGSLCSLYRTPLCRGSPYSLASQDASVLFCACPATSHLHIPLVPLGGESHVAIVSLLLFLLLLFLLPSPLPFPPSSSSSFSSSSSSCPFPPLIQGLQVTQATLELTTLLTQPSKCWDSRHTPPCPAPPPTF